MRRHFGLSLALTCGLVLALGSTAYGQPGAPLSQADTNKVLTWIAQQVSAENQPYCYKQSYGRSAGTPLTTCPGSMQKDGALCYPKCKAGYGGAGPVCWQTCPSGYHDDGTHCAKPAAYGRGAGYPWHFGDALNNDGMLSRCAHDHPEGCEMNGAIAYPKCKAGFHNVGCCECSPDCPSGMTDIGVSCQKQSYGRGAGEPMGCAAGLQKDAALCYPACKSNYHGIGPVCWQNCPQSRPFECGAGCSQVKAECTQDTANMVIAPVMMVVNILTVAETAGAGGEAAKAAEEAAESAFKTAMKDGASAAQKDAAKAAFKVSAAATAEGLQKSFSRRIAETLASKLKPNVQTFVVTAYSQALLGTKLAQQQTTGSAAATTEALGLLNLDPTGVSDVVLAFSKPICEEDSPFPVITQE